MYRIGKEEIDAVARAIYSKDFFKINGSGQEVKHFEEEWKELLSIYQFVTKGDDAND